MVGAWSVPLVLGAPLYSRDVYSYVAQGRMAQLGINPYLHGPLSLGDGSSSLALYEWDAAAADAGVSSEGSGFRGVSFHYVVPSRDAVDEVMGNAVAAGGSVVKEAASAQWGGYAGYFSDPDGHLWKVAANA